MAPPVDGARLRAALGGPLPLRGADPGYRDRAAGDGGRDRRWSRTAGPRYFGFVVGGRARRRHGADVLTAGWDQLGLQSPRVSGRGRRRGGGRRVAEGGPRPARARRRSASSRAGRARTPLALAAARHRVLAAGRLGRRDARPDRRAAAIRVVAGEERHATIDRSLRLLGIGADARGAGRRRPQRRDRSPRHSARALGRRLRGTHHRVPPGRQREHRRLRRPGAPRASSRTRRGAWVHVDGAFGLWAARQPVQAAPRERHRAGRLVGRRRAQVAERPLRRGLRVLRRHRGPRRLRCRTPPPTWSGRATGAMRVRPPTTSPNRRAGPGASRRGPRCASSGEQGLAELVDRCCALARRFGEQLGAIEGVEIANDIVLNQVL